MKHSMLTKISSTQFYKAWVWPTSQGPHIEEKWLSLYQQPPNAINSLARDMECIHAHGSTWTHTHAHTHPCTCTHTHAHMHMYTHMHTPKHPLCVTWLVSPDLSYFLSYVLIPTHIKLLYILHLESTKPLSTSESSTPVLTPNIPHNWIFTYILSLTLKNISIALQMALILFTAQICMVF